MNLTYIAICSAESNPGVIKKIVDWTEAARELGFVTQLKIIPPTGGLNAYLKLNSIVLNSKSELLLIRNPSHFRILLLFSIFIARVNGCKVIIDVPTPIKTLTNEILLRKQNSIFKLFAVFEIIITGSLPFLFAHKIIEYANEGWWFTLGCRSKVMLIGNGINLNRIKVREHFPQWPSNKLILVGVANVAIWHGYDRIIRAISIFNNRAEYPYKVHFNIIGDGPELNNLKQKVNELKIEESILFHGMQSDTYFIQSIYENSHLAVSSLGLFRKGLNAASDLKSREYVGIGIPFISAGNDIDFLNKTDFRFTLTNNDSIQDILELFEGFSNVNFPEPLHIRKYAENNLTVVKKLKLILDSIK